MGRDMQIEGALKMFSTFFFNSDDLKAPRVVIIHNPRRPVYELYSPCIAIFIIQFYLYADDTTLAPTYCTCIVQSLLVSFLSLISIVILPVVFKHNKISFLFLNLSWAKSQQGSPKSPHHSHFQQLL